MEKYIHHNAESSASCNGIEIAYDTFGDRTSSPVLLIMGLASQMILWEEEFCSLLATKGFRVIRFDNRDIGRSTKLDSMGIPNIQELFAGKAVPVPYLLRDMARDTISLLDALHIDSAHIVGASMGGMIAQEIAIRHPHRMRSLTSIMSTTGDPSLPPPKPEALQVLFKPYSTQRDQFIKTFIETWKVLSGAQRPMGEERILNLADKFYERGVYPAGTARQLAAVVASGNRKPDLAFVRIPSLVIHGDADPLVPVECGIDTANSIPGARLRIIPGMGHALSESLWPVIIDAFEEHAQCSQK